MIELIASRNITEIRGNGQLAQDGYATLAALSSRMGIFGFQLRPKLHMMFHIVLLGQCMVVDI